MTWTARDPPRHQPRLRLAPLPARHAGDRVAGRRANGSSSPPAPPPMPSSRDFGFERVDLRLGRGSNPGVIRAERAAAGRGRRPCAASSTRPGGAPWRPSPSRPGPPQRPALAAHRGRLATCCASSTRCGPTRSSSTTSPSVHASPSPARGCAMPTSCSGTPSARRRLTRSTAYPPRSPGGCSPRRGRARRAAGALRGVRDAFTAEWNQALAAPRRSPPSSDAFAETGDALLLNYPGRAPRSRPDGAAPTARVPRLGRAHRGARRGGGGLAGLGRRAGGLRQPRQLPLGAVRRAGRGRRGAARARRPRGARERFDPRRGPRPAPAVVARPAGAPPGPAPRVSGPRRLARWQQQRHGGADRGSAPRPPPTVDRPVRRCRRRRRPASARCSTRTPRRPGRSARWPPGSWHSTPTRGRAWRGCAAS